MKIQNAKIDAYIKNITQEKIAGCLLFGPEPSVISARFSIIAKKIVDDLADPFLVSNISKERLAEDKALLGDEFYSMSFMGGRKLITIKDTDAHTASALKALLSEEDILSKSENFILIQAGDLDYGSALRKLAESSKIFAAIPCYEDNEKVIKQFIEASLTKNQIRFDYQTSSYLSQKLGKNRQIIKSELDKIIAYLGDNKALNIDIVDTVIGFESEVTANEFVLTYASQKFDKALLEAQRLLNNHVEPITLIRFLSNYLQKLYHAKCQIHYKNMNFDEVVKSQKLFFKTEIEFRKNLNALSLAFISKKLQELEKLEIKMKSSQMSSKVLFIGFMQDSLKK